MKYLHLQCCRPGLECHYIEIFIFNVIDQIKVSRVLLLSLHGGSLEITLTVPLNTYICLLQELEKDAEEQEKLRKKERKKQLKTMYKV